ncbi:dephospho-CoA kinase [Oryza brachyantha]|uniref:Dephospho-CoA kinase n=1 Tax=Oryza brachyantha TaxID=4533 RepID=J3KZU3_ORYBR|nr:dephospho-CoA kinase [Oryza brachyantha]XP_006644166.1 dephospho-CoA kinase [Oryza brachyantha]
MRLVGLTGGIASGKSTISNFFKASGIPVVDADIVARNVVQKGTGGWKKIVEAFGNDVLLENGEIDRARLGQIVFSDPAKRQILNRLLAPYISSGIFWEILKLWIKGCKVIVLDIPLLFETKMNQWTHPVIVVWVNEETQIQRLMSRDGCSEEQARNRINAQLALDWKKSEADIVIDNSGTLDETKEKFQQVLRKVSEPLTWKERLRSRDGLFSVVVCTAVGLILAQKNLL